MKRENAPLLLRNNYQSDFNQQNHIPDDIHKMSHSDLESLFNTSITSGLTGLNYAKNLSIYGPNELRKPKSKPLYIIFITQHLCSTFNIIVSVAFLATIITCAFKGFAPDDISFLIVIFIIILFTSLFTFISDQKRSNVINKLQEMGQISNAMVKRDGVYKQVDGKLLVPGDIIILNAGDRIPADIIVLESKNCKVDNSSMTGESLPVRKTIKVSSDNLMQSENVLLFSTHIMSGSATGMIIATANDTKLSKLFNFNSEKALEDTPMIIEINRFMYLSIGLAIIMCVGLIIAAIFKKMLIVGIIFSISIIISCIPEGLIISYLSAVTITANRLQDKSVQIKKLKAGELFGNMTTLFLDKTGTITENKLHVSNFVDSKFNIIKSDKYSSENDDKIFETMVLGSDSVLVEDLKNIKRLSQDQFINSKENALETSLLKFAYETNTQLAVEKLESSRRIFTMPFNSKDKFSYGIVEIFKNDGNQNSSRCILIAKGAPERLIKICKECREDENFFDSQMAKYMSLSSTGERGVALASIDLTESHGLDFDFESNPIDLKSLNDLSFVAIISMRDKIRDTSRNCIMNLRSAGITTIMVTGDHFGTAKYVARKSGIIFGHSYTADELAEMRGVDVLSIDPSETSSIVLNGDLIEKIPEERLREIFIDFPEVVIARCTPEHKIKAIKAMKSINDMDSTFLRENKISQRIVAVIGDGTNDAPSLKLADIGISMSGNGTELTQEVAMAILKDDNLIGIVSAVKESRQLRDNTLKGISYISRSLLSEMCPALAMFFFTTVPFNLPSIMIVLDVILSMIPSIALAYEKTESDIMKIRPEKLREKTTTSFSNICQNFFVYSVFGLVLSLTTFLVVYSALDMYPKDILFINKHFSDPLLVMMVENERAYSYQVRMDLRSNGIMEYMKMNIIIQMIMYILSKTRRVSLFKHGFFNNNYMNAALVMNISVCLIITLIQVQFFSFLDLGLIVIIPISLLVTIYGGILALIFDETRKYIINRFNFFEHQSLMWHVYF